MNKETTQLLLKFLSNPEILHVLEPQTLKQVLKDFAPHIIETFDDVGQFGDPVDSRNPNCINRTATRRSIFG